MDPERRRVARVGIAVTLAAGIALLFAMGLAGARAMGMIGGPPSFVGTAWDPPQEAADFRLTAHDGEPVSMRDFRGRAVLLFFGYTNCPDVCPLTLAKLDRVLDSMDADTADVRVLLVSVDPDRDTPQALERYVSRFGPWVTGATGTAEDLAAVRKAYFTYAEPAPSPSPAGHGEHAPAATGPADFSHSPQVLGIDRTGRIRVLLPMERSEAEIARDIRTLLRV